MVRKLKDDGVSTREIARRIGVCEKSVRKLLKRMGWQAKPQFDQPALPGLDLPATLAVETPMDPAAQGVTGGFPHEPSALSLDTDPADRHFDRLLACMGALDDALPLFQSGQRIPHAGVLLTVPALIQSGFLSVAREVYQIESDLLALISPHYARSEDEGRTLVQNLLASAADLKVTPKELRVKVTSLSSPHRTRVLAALCKEHNLGRTTFPGSRLQLRFSVSGSFT
jgi:hypothetical protein